MSQRYSQATSVSFHDAAAFSLPPVDAHAMPVRHVRSRRSTAMAALIVLLALGFLFTVSDMAEDNPALTSPLALDIICLAVGLIPAVVRAARERFDIFEPIHLVIAAFTLLTGVRALYLITYQTTVYSRVPSDNLLSAALALSILGMVSVYTGYYSGVGDHLAFSMPRWPALGIGELRYPPTMIALAALIGLTSMAVLGSEIAGIEGQRSVLDSAGLFWLMPLSYCAPFALYMMVLNIEHEPPTFARLMTFLCLLAVILAFFLLRPSKDWILRLFYYPLVFYHYRRGRLRPFRSGLIGAVALVAIFSWGVIGHLYVKAFAYDSGDTVHYLSSRLESPREFFDMLLSRFYGIDSIAVIIEHVRQTGHFWMGSSLGEVFYWFVPRAVWPGKPYTFSFTFARLFQSYLGWGGEAYAATTLIGELYLNFSIIGVVAGSFIFGLLLRVVYVYLVGRVQTKSAIMLYSIILIQLVEFSEGPIGAHVALMLSEVAPFVIILYITRVAGSFRPHAPVLG